MQRQKKICSAFREGVSQGEARTHNIEMERILANYSIYSKP